MLQEHKTRPREDAREKIENFIVKESLKAHDRLPSERDLCELWGINRMTLRGAIQALITEGVLYNRKGSGTFYAPPKLERSLQDLKSISVIVNEVGSTLTTRVLSQRVIECNKQIAKKLTLKLGHPVYELIRLREIDGQPLMIETTYMDHIKFSALDGHDFSKESLYQVIETETNIQIHKGKESLGITYATEEEATLLHIEAETPLFFLTGVVRDQEDVPIEYFKTVARTDKVRFTTKLIKV